MARASRQPAPLPDDWPKLGDGRPIERFPNIEADHPYARPERARRMLALKKYFGIEEPGWYELACCLAAMLDPALKIDDWVYEPPKRGKPKSAADGHLLVQYVDCCRAEGMTIPEAIAEAHKNHFSLKHYTLKTLTERYFEELRERKPKSKQQPAARPAPPPEPKPNPRKVPTLSRDVRRFTK